MYRVALVCEGPADRAILEAVLDAHLEDYQPVPIHPPRSAIGGDAGGLGGGWKGVRTWCRQEADLTPLGALMQNCDMLVIQLDADVSREPELACACACPPPRAGADQVRSLLREWLGATHLPGKVVLCVPSMASETWALAALFPASSAIIACDPPPEPDECIECRMDVKSLLRTLGARLRPKLVVSQGGKMKNQARGYRAHQALIARAWETVVAICGEAARFDAELRVLISTAPPGE